MHVTVNGEGKEVPEALSVRDLLALLGVPGDRVAVEHNLSVLPREKWETTRVQPEDRFEIVHFVGGG